MSQRNPMLHIPREQLRKPFGAFVAASRNLRVAVDDFHAAVVRCKTERKEKS